MEQRLFDKDIISQGPTFERPPVEILPVPLIQ
jgi:hypothetical protein